MFSRFIYWVVLLYKLLNFNIFREIFYRTIIIFRKIPILSGILRYVELVSYRFGGGSFFYFSIIRLWIVSFVLVILIYLFDKFILAYKILEMPFHQEVFIGLFLPIFLFVPLLLLSKYTLVVLLSDYSFYIFFIFFFQNWYWFEEFSLCEEEYEISTFLDDYIGYAKMYNWEFYEAILDVDPYEPSFQDEEEEDDFFGLTQQLVTWLDFQSCLIIFVVVFYWILLSCLARYYEKDEPVLAVPYLGNRVLGDNCYDVELFLRQLRWLLRHKPSNVASFISLRLEDFLALDPDDEEISSEVMYELLDQAWVSEEFEEEEDMDFLEEYEYLRTNEISEEDFESFKDQRVVSQSKNLFHDDFTNMWLMEEFVSKDTMEGFTHGLISPYDPDPWVFRQNNRTEFDLEQEFLEYELDEEEIDVEELPERELIEEFEDEREYELSESESEIFWSEDRATSDEPLIDEFYSEDLEMPWLELDVFLPTEVEDLITDSESAIQILLWRYKWLLVRSFFFKHGIDLAGSSYREFLNLFSDSDLNKLDLRFMSIYAKELAPYVSVLSWKSSGEDVMKWLEEDQDESSEFFEDQLASGDPNDVAIEPVLFDYYLDSNVTHALMKDLIYGGFSNYIDWRKNLVSFVHMYEQNNYFLLSLKPNDVSAEEWAAKFEIDRALYFEFGHNIRPSFECTKEELTKYSYLLQQHSVFYEGLNLNTSPLKLVEVLSLGMEDLQLYSIISESFNSQPWDSTFEKDSKRQARILHTFENERDLVLTSYLELYANSGLLENIYYDLFGGLVESSVYDIVSGRAFLFLDISKGDVCLWLPFVWNLGFFYSKQVEAFVAAETSLLIVADEHVAREINLRFEEYLYFDWVRSVELGFTGVADRLWLDEYRALAEVIERPLVESFVDDDLEWPEDDFDMFERDLPKEDIIWGIWLDQTIEECVNPTDTAVVEDDQYEYYIVNSMYEVFFEEWVRNIDTEILVAKEDLFHEDMTDFSSMLIDGWDVQDHDFPLGHLASFQSSVWLEKGSYRYDFDMRTESITFSANHIKLLLNRLSLDFVFNEMPIINDLGAQQYNFFFWNNLKLHYIESLGNKRLQLELFFLFNNDSNLLSSYQLLKDEKLLLLNENVFLFFSPNKISFLEERFDAYEFNSIISSFYFDVRFRLPLEPLATHFSTLSFEEDDDALDIWEFVAEDVVCNSDGFNDQYLFYIDEAQYCKGWYIFKNYSSSNFFIEGTVLSLVYLNDHDTEED